MNPLTPRKAPAMTPGTLFDDEPTQPLNPPKHLVRATLAAQAIDAVLWSIGCLWYGTGLWLIIQIVHHAWTDRIPTMPWIIAVVLVAAGRLYIETGLDMRRTWIAGWRASRELRQAARSKAIRETNLARKVNQR